MELVPIHKRVIGLDIHQAQVTACAIIEESGGETRLEQRQFGAFKRDRRELAVWAAALDPDEVVMESTGIYWKSPYAALEAVGIRATVVNARHVKQVPGRTALTHDPAQSGSFAGSPAFAAGAVKSRGAGGRRARDTRVEWGSWRGFREVSGTPVRSLDEPFPARTMPYGGMLGPSWADHSSCSRKGSARSPRIRAESSQGAAQEVRMKRIAPRTPN
jgi:hypothetical protein